MYKDKAVKIVYDFCAEIDLGEFSPPLRVAANMAQDRRTIQDYTYYFHYESASRYIHDPENFVDDKYLQDAYLLIYKAITEYHETLLRGMQHPAYNQMDTIVTNTMKAYRSDFDYHDVKFLGEFPSREFVWLVRESGTWLLGERFPESFFFFREQDHDCYHYNGKQLKKISVQKGLEILNTLKPQE